MTVCAPSDISVVTVVTEAFVPGALVMFASFLRQHPAFTGDLIAIHDGLSEDAEARLTTLSPRMRLIHAGQELRDRIDALAQALPGIAATRNRFLSLDALRPGLAQRLLLCDSDLVFLKPVPSLLNSSQDVTAVGDGCYLRGNARDPVTLAEIAPRTGALNETFNAGVMALGPGALTGADFAAAMAELSVQRFGQLECRLHDQAIFNLVFHGRCDLVDWRYNYLLKHHGLIQTNTPVAQKDICVVHFNGAPKPWNYGMDQVGKITGSMQKWAAFQWHATARALGRIDLPR